MLKKLNTIIIMSIRDQSARDVIGAFRQYENSKPLAIDSIRSVSPARIA